MTQPSRSPINAVVARLLHSERPVKTLEREGLGDIAASSRVAVVAVVDLVSTGKLDGARGTRILAHVLGDDASAALRALCPLLDSDDPDVSDFAFRTAKGLIQSRALDEVDLTTRTELHDKAMRVARDQHARNRFVATRFAAGLGLRQTRNELLLLAEEIPRSSTAALAAIVDARLLSDDEVHDIVQACSDFAERHLSPLHVVEDLLVNDRTDPRSVHWTRVLRPLSCQQTSSGLRTAVENREPLLPGWSHELRSIVEMFSQHDLEQLAPAPAYVDAKLRESLGRHGKASPDGLPTRLLADLEGDLGAIVALLAKLPDGRGLPALGALAERSWHPQVRTAARVMPNAIGSPNLAETDSEVLRTVEPVVPGSRTPSDRFPSRPTTTPTTAFRKSSSTPITPI
jgi:hypothetical protein